MSEHLDRAEKARERNAGLEYAERWEEDRYDRDAYEREQYDHDRQRGEYAEEDEDE